ncbi:MAG: methyltransferase domain-containing protein [Zoogloeaceae bacterium]|jgi:SAM-dependent methyltransferase|nr:methyltransferase domain-containing protein [Zoogloeaceae bacterium]
MTQPGYAHHIPQVADELEQLILREIAMRVRNNEQPYVLDLRCGEGRHSVTMASLGARVLAVDDPKQEARVRDLAQASACAEHVEFAPFAEIPKEGLPEGPFDLVFSHHGICLMPYPKARQSLRRILKSLRVGGKLYLSAYGLHSALGEGYADAEAPIEERFSELAPAIAKSYNIKGPLCLYSERNLVTLLFEAGGSVLRSFTTTHGTIKAVAVRM